MEVMNQSDSNEQQELSARVLGEVQGVGFRQFVVQHATRLGLHGYVRNASDGNVEVTAQGTRIALEHLCDLLRQGPTASQVNEVQVKWKQIVQQFSGFHVRW
ncbi:MAG TPA: acylphosphatase [Ktedonobacteraceae bacterium]|nr:acylphosphatase [Ktedonobacteraceae bacterium]